MSAKIKDVALTYKNLFFMTDVYQCPQLTMPPAGVSITLTLESHFNLFWFDGKRHHYLRKLLKKSKQARLMVQICYKANERKTNLLVEFQKMWLQGASKKLEQFFSSTDGTPITAWLPPQLHRDVPKFHLALSKYAAQLPTHAAYLLDQT